MAEDFPHYQHEDSDDDAPAERAAEAPAVHASPASAPEHTPPAPVGQEGTIFSRDTIAPTLSRPLFDFIRNQEQPKAQPEMPAEPTVTAPEELPSVSVPAEPEMRTYQPPAEAEVAQAAHAAKEATAETDDDDDEAVTDDASAHAAPPPAAPVAAPVPHAQEVPHNLNEQFERILRQEMDEDFAKLTSDEQLGIDEETPAPAGAKPEPRHFVPDRPVAMPTAEMPSPVLEATEIEPEASIDTLPEAPPLPAEMPAFYYAEDAPDPGPLPPTPPAGTSRPTTTTTHPLATGSPPPPPIIGGGSGGGGGGGGGGSGGPFGAPSGGFNAAPNFAPVAALNPVEVAVPAARQERAHHGRWFVAGFITGWVVKQHFANKKLRAQQAVHEKAIDAQNEKLDTAAYNQYHTEQRLKRTEVQLQQTQTEQEQAQRAAKAAENDRLNQEQRERFIAAAQRTPVAPEGVPLAAAAAAPVVAERLTRPDGTPAATVQAPQASSAERPMPPASTSAEMEMPLQYAAAAEAPLAAVAAAAAPGAERQRPAAFASETAPKPTAERPPKTAQEEAQEAVAQAFELEQGQHIERATGGGHDIIVDKHGHEVQNARTYAKEFQNQKRQEQLKVDVFATGNSTSDNSAASYNNNGKVPDYSSNIITGLGSGQMGADHSLPAGPPSATSRQHLLPSKHQNPIVATVTSPWLWASVVVLIAAFFVAMFVG